MNVHVWFALFGRGAAPASLLEDFLASFHGRMIERERTRGEELPLPSYFDRGDSQNRAARADFEEEASTGDYPRSCEETTRGTSIASPPTDVGVQHKGGRDRSSRCRNKRSEKADREGSSDAADTGVRGNLASVGDPLGVRDTNSRRTRGHVSSSACAGSAGTAATPVTLIRDPFSPDERRRLTTNTASYKHWASSSSIVRISR